MTINSTAAFSGPYVATGVAQLFPFSFNTKSRDEVRVTANGIAIDPATYSVTLEDDGTGTVSATLTAGVEVYVESNPDFAQSANFSRFAPYFPDAINVHLDRAAIRDIYLRDKVERAPQLPFIPTDAQGLFPTVDANGAWVFTPSGPGAAGPADAFRILLSDLKAAAVTDGKSDFDGSTWYWTPGNFTGQADDVNIVKADTTALTVGAWVRQTADGVTSQVPATGAKPRTVENRLNEVISLADFGYVGNSNDAGTTGADDTAAWAAAIAAAGALNIRTIRVPWGVTGKSRVTGQILNGPMPTGLRFVGESSGPPNAEWGPYVQLLYTGAGTCFFVNYAGLGGDRGFFGFKSICFRATDPAGTIFDINDATPARVITDVDGYSYASDILFEDCFAYGAHGGAAQTGDFFRGAKLFGMRTDGETFARGWRRAFWLRGSDNCRLNHAGFLNARLAMIEGSGTFANDNRIELGFAGGSPAASSEEVYDIWDNGNTTTIVGNLAEDNEIGGIKHKVASCYLDGISTRIIGLHVGDQKVFRLGPNLREATLIDPSNTGAIPGAGPTIDPPTTWDFGYEQQDYRLTIIGADRNAQLYFGRHPRIRYIGGAQTTGSGGAERTQIDALRHVIADARGVRPAVHSLHAFNIWSRSIGTAASDGFTVAEDASASNGWALSLDRTKAQPGIFAALVCGTDFQPGDKLEFVARAKTPSLTGWSVSVQQLSTDGTVVSEETVTFAADGLGWLIGSSIFMADGWTIGQRLALLAFKPGSPANNLLVDHATFSIRERLPIAADDVAAAALVPPVPLGGRFITAVGAVRERVS